MRIRLLMDHGTHKKGEVWNDPDGFLAQNLVDLEVAEVVSDTVNGTPLRHIGNLPKRDKPTLRLK